MGTNKGFTGQYADATGLDYYNARYYDPVIGRFLSADTVQGNGAGMDPYDYVGGNPETLTDPTGHHFSDEPDLNEEEMGGGGSGGMSDGSDGSKVVESESNGGKNKSIGSKGGSDPTVNPTVLDPDAFASEPSPTGEADSGNIDGNDEPKGSDPTKTPTDPAKTPSTEPTDPAKTSSTDSTKPASPANTMDPNSVGFTQDTISSRGNGYTVQGNIDALKNGTLDPADLPKIRVFQATDDMQDWVKTKYGHTGYGKNLIPGEWYALDNRRLYTFQQVGITDVPVEEVTNWRTIFAEAWKFTTNTWGIDIELVP